MSDHQSKEQNYQSQIDDPAMFLNLDSRQQESRQRRPQSASNDDNYVPEAVDEEQNKNQDAELYQPEPQSNYMDDDQQEKENQGAPLDSEPERHMQRTVQSLPSEPQNGAQTKNATKKRKKIKKKDVDSQQDEYSGEYSSRRKTKAKDIKKGVKKNDPSRSRGKPRGRGSASKLRQVRIPTYPQDRKVLQKDLEKKKSQTTLKKSSVSFNSNWKVGGQFQQDWDSSNAQIYSQSIHKRFQNPVHAQLISLIENNFEKAQDLIQSIRKLPHILYTTLN